MLGAATPISLWLLAQWYEMHESRKDNRYRLLKFIGFNLNGLVQARETVTGFLEEKIPATIAKIDESSARSSYAMGTAFFPLFAIHPIEGDILGASTGSGYLDNQALQILQMAKDFALAVDDLRRQFDFTIQSNRELCLAKVDAPRILNEAFKANLQEFASVARAQILEINCNVYLKTLVTAQVSLQVYEELGPIHWHLRFGLHFKYFRDKNAMTTYTKGAQERISRFLED
jgi:hypothetical protein